MSPEQAPSVSCSLRLAPAVTMIILGVSGLANIPIGNSLSAPSCHSLLAHGSGQPVPVYQEPAGSVCQSAIAVIGFQLGASSEACRALSPAVFPASCWALSRCLSSVPSPLRSSVCAAAMARPLWLAPPIAGTAMTTPVAPRRGRTALRRALRPPRMRRYRHRRHHQRQSWP